MSSRLEAELAAEGLRARLGLSGAYVDPFAALSGLNVATLCYPLPRGSFDGAYQRREDEAFAIINTNADTTRQRFTAAHEIGHHVLWEPDDPQSSVDVDLDDPDPASAGREQIIDTFAAAFLMPVALVRGVVGEESDGARAILAVAAAFDVSKSAAARRVVALDLVTSADAETLQKDRRKMSVLLTANGIHAEPRPRRRGYVSVDSRHLKRVERLVGIGQVSNRRSLLDLT